MLTEKLRIFVQYTDLLRRFLRVPDKHVDRIEHAVAKGGPHLNYDMVLGSGLAWQLIWRRCLGVQAHVP